MAYDTPLYGIPIYQAVFFGMGKHGICHGSIWIHQNGFQENLHRSWPETICFFSISGVPVNFPLNRSIHGWNPVKSQCDPDSHSDFHRISVRKSPMFLEHFQSQAHWLLTSSMGKNDRAGVSGCSTFTRIHVGFELWTSRKTTIWMTEVGHHMSPWHSESLHNICPLYPQ